jgi:hypothetical protein
MLDFTRLAKELVRVVILSEAKNLVPRSSSVKRMD